MGLEIVSLILPCVKKLVCFRIPPAQAPPRHCWCHVLVAGPEPTSHCSRRVLPEGEFGCINHVCFGSASLTQLGGRYAIILLVETTAVNAPCSTLAFSMTGALLGLGPETLTKTDHSGCFLTLQQGCLLLVPESCYHSNIAMLAQTQIDSILIALISSLR